MTAFKRRYWAYTGNEEEALKNGSFLRFSEFCDPGLAAEFINGDHMGAIQIPTDTKRYTEVNADYAVDLIPKCCGGLGKMFSKHGKKPTGQARANSGGRAAARPVNK